jgi:cystathionine beta-synthase
VVTFACDSGNKSLEDVQRRLDATAGSSRALRPAISDYIARHDEGATVTAAPDDTLSTVLARMRV